MLCVVDTEGQVTLIAEESTPAPDTTETFGEDFFAQPLLGGNGHAAFDAQFTDVGSPLDIDAIYAMLEGDLRLVARTGDPAPGFADGITFRALQSPTVTDSGFVAFEATTSGGTEGIWGGRRGDLRLIARAGDRLNVSGTVRTIQFLELARGSDGDPHGSGQDGHETVLNDCGQLVFWVRTELEPPAVPASVSAIVYVDQLIEKDDIDCDGIPCLLEEAFGTDCNDAGDGPGGLPRIHLAENRAVLQFRRRSTGEAFVYTVEISPDGRSWSDLPDEPAPSDDQGGLPAGFERVEVSVPANGREMLRVRVSRL